jgi:hypothetical protein
MAQEIPSATPFAKSKTINERFDLIANCAHDLKTVSSKVFASDLTCVF